MIGLMLVAACGSDWGSLDLPEDQFSPEATIAFGAGEALFGGHRRHFGGAAILRLDGQTIRPVFERENGDVAAMTRRDDRVWAVLGAPRTDQKPGSSYTLLRSDDRGRTWSTAGAAPFGSVSQVFAFTRDELWLHTTSGLARSDDGGMTWDVVVAPGTRSPFRELFAAVDGGVAILTSESIVTRDGGETWESLGIDGELVAEDPERQTIQLLTSSDAGRSWTRDRVGAHTFGPIWALAPDGSTLVFAPGDRSVRIRPPG